MRSGLRILLLAPFTALLLGCAHDAIRQRQLDRLAGNWVNANAQTRGVMRFAIARKDGQLVVEMWGKCHPQDCRWGWVPAQTPKRATNEIHADWYTTFSIDLQTLILNDDRIELRGHVHYTDESGRPDRDYSEQFVRGDPRS